MNKIRKPLSFLLAVVMIISMFAAVPFTASAEDGYTEYELALGLPNPDVIKDCTYQYYFYYANVPIIDPNQDETFSTLPDGDIVVWPEGSGIAVVDAKGYAYKFYDNTGVELPASMTDNETGSGSELGLSADVTLYRKIFSITFTQAAMDSEVLYIVATAPATDPDVENVIALIDAIGTVENTAASKEKIDDARAAYDALTDTQKTLVTNYTTLTDAETAYANLKAAAELAQAKTDAKDALDNYKSADDYRADEQVDLANTIADGKQAIDAATTVAEVNTALANAKAAIDAIKTDAQLTAEEAAAALAQAKADAKDALDNYKSADDYRADEQVDLANTIADGKQAIDAAADAEAVATALANAKAAIDAIKTDAELTAEEAAAKAKDWMSVRIDDQIYIKYLLQKRENLESVTVEYLDQDGVEAVQTKVYTADQLTFDGNDMFEILAVVAPAQIGDMVKVTILANGQPTEYEYSVAKYCEYLIANYNGENARAVRELAKATLEYGKAANDYFYGTGFYHQSTITSPYSAEYKEEALHRAKNLTNTLSVTDNLRTKLASAAFMALTKPEFRFYTTGLTEEEAYELNSKITTNVDGVTAKFYKNGDAILLEVEGIKAEDMDKIITITVGELGTITFSGYDFARMMAKSDDQSIAALGAALYLYGDAAKACFA